MTEFKGKLGYISHQEQSCHQVKERVPQADPGSRIQNPNVPFYDGLKPYWTWRDAAHSFPTVYRALPCPAPTLAKNALHSLGLTGGQSDCAFQWQLRLGLKELTPPLDSPAPISFSAFADSTSTGTSIRNKPGKGHTHLKNLQTKAVLTPHPEGWQGRWPYWRSWGRGHTPGLADGFCTPAAYLASTQGTQSHPWQSRGTKISQALKEGMIKMSFLNKREGGKEDCRRK